MRDFEIDSTPALKASTTSYRSGISKADAPRAPASAVTASSTSAVSLRTLASLGPLTTSRFVLQLQRQYGNRCVQRALMPAGHEEDGRAGDYDERFDATAGPRQIQSSTMLRTLQRGAAGAAPPPTEHLRGTLWATDESGKVLPPSLDDIAQGAVNDCFLFAAMAAIVNANPQRIIDMIRDNGNGTYTVTFKGLGSFFSSAEQTVSADFTVGQHGNVWTRKALWPLIIEKAYGQQKGGLEALNKGGNAGNAIDDMLDEGSSRFDPREKSADYIMGKLAKAKEKKWPMTILSPQQEGAPHDKQAIAESTPGLHWWHTYAIIDLDPANNRIKLFNPWGRDHPNGDGWMDIEKVRTFFIDIEING